MLWIKALHIIFVVTWFAGLFYLPRLFIYHVAAKDEISIERFKVMERRLYNGIMTPSAVFALVPGLTLFLQYGIGSGSAWMHAKLLFVVMALGYHHLCGRILRQIEAGTHARSHLWYRGFNEWPVLIMLITVALVVIKPADLGEFFLHLTLPVIALIVLAWVTIRAQRR